MPLYVYIKNSPVKYKEKVACQNWLDRLSNLMFLTGLAAVLFVCFPLLNYKIKLYLRREKEIIIAPVPNSMIVRSELTASSNSRVLASEADVLPEPNLELVVNWFPSAPIKEQRESKITDYTISVPKLGIKDAKVKIGGKELKESLVQYAGTALPGEYGNTVIFGHSVLPQFFNPTNYKTIFSTLPDLEKGDQIIVDFDGVRFVYVVERYFEIEPSEVEVLEQRFDRQTLTLITCVPPGTYWRRGVVRAYLQNLK